MNYKLHIFLLFSVYIMCIMGYVQDVYSMALERVDDDIATLADMLSDCQLYQVSLQVPHNTPELASAGDEKIEGDALFSCLFAQCCYQCRSQLELQEHAASEHGIFLCNCGAWFHNFEAYTGHFQFCGQINQ
jgi:hypothetical protein